MIKTERGLVVRVVQVRVKLAEHGGQSERFVNDGAVREGRDVEVLHFLRAQVDADLAAADVEDALEFIVAHAIAALD